MEVLLLLFIFSGLLKGYLLFLDISFPIDITVFTLVLILLKFSFDSIKKNKPFVVTKFYINSIFLLLLFYLWIIFTLIYTPSKHYSLQKAGYFGLNFLAFSLPLLYGNINVKKFIKGVVIISISCGLAYLPFQFLYQLGEMATTGIEQLASVSGMYLDIGEYLGLSLVFCATSSDKLWKSSFLNSLITFTCLIILLLIGARGPLIFSILIIVIDYVFKRKINLFFLFRVNYIFRLLIFIILFFLIYLNNRDYVDVLFERTLSRFMVLSENDSSNISAISRIEFFEVSLHHIFKNPFVLLLGNGVGSFGILVFNQDIRAYPHNIILEIIFEFGVFGFLLFVSWIFLSIKNIKEKSSLISNLILLYMMFNVLKSSSLVDIRLFFIIFAFYISSNKIKINTNENITRMS